jgi:hypothetical protein
MNPKHFGIMVAAYIVAAAIVVSTFITSVGLLTLICW